MNQDRMGGKYEQFKGKLKEKWGKLTDDDVTLYEGQQEQFYGKLREKHGVVREDAEKLIKELEKACGCHDEKAA